MYIPPGALFRFTCEGRVVNCRLSANIRSKCESSVLTKKPSKVKKRRSRTWKGKDADVHGKATAMQVKQAPSTWEMKSATRHRTASGTGNFTVHSKEREATKIEYEKDINGRDSSCTRQHWLAVHTYRRQTNWLQAKLQAKTTTQKIAQGRTAMVTYTGNEKEV